MNVEQLLDFVIKDCHCYPSLLIRGRRNINKLALVVKKTKKEDIVLGKYGIGGDVWDGERKYGDFENREKMYIRRLSFSEMTELTSKSR